MLVRTLLVLAALVPIAAAAAPVKQPERVTIGPPVAARPELEAIKRAQAAAWRVRTAALSPHAAAALVAAPKPASVTTRVPFSDTQLAAVRRAQDAKSATAPVNLSRSALAPRPWSGTALKPVMPNAPAGPAPVLSASQRAKLATIGRSSAPAK
jgi:hypothetical protein